MDVTYSQCHQDLCVLALLKNSGRFLDIGSGPPVELSNTYLLEANGWTGIAIDAQLYGQYDYSKRSCQYFPGDAVDTINNHVHDTFFDYISLDIDEATTDAVRALINQGISFKFATVEHDKYRIGPEAQQAQQALLWSAGYVPMFIDIVAHFDRSIVFEDWWCHKDIHQSTIATGVTDLKALDMIRKLP